MSKKQFTLDSWLKDKSQKVVTRDGKPVRIVCTNLKRDLLTILAVIDFGKKEDAFFYSKNGEFSGSGEHYLDLFIETDDPEVSEDENVRKDIINYFQCQSEEEPTRKEIHNKWITWLEKQGEQIDTANKEYWRGYREGKKLILDKYAETEKQNGQDILEDAILDGNEDGLIAETIRYKHEKQSEQKSDKVEPKFKKE